MPTITININGYEVNKELSEEQSDGLQYAMDKVNSRDIQEEQEPYDTKENYLTAIISNWATLEGANTYQVEAMIDQCLDSWINKDF